MPMSSSPSPTITPIKTHPQTLTLTHEEDGDLLNTYQLHPESLLMEEEEEAAEAPHHDLDENHPFTSLIFRDDDEDEEEEDDDEGDEDQKPSLQQPFPDPSDPLPSDDKSTVDGGDCVWPVVPAVHHAPRAPYIDPAPHISSQFYTFNCDSHSLMVRCILDGRLATPDEIRHATPRPVLKSWRSVWKDRNEDTAYLTAWKRIQDKLHAHVDSEGNHLLYFKNNSSQYVSHVDQWHDIVTSFHGDADLRHLGLKETIERIKQVWTVGAKFYGIPESFIRVCVASCIVCSSTGGPSPGGTGGAARTKRRRFEYTESFDVPARDVPQRLQHLAAKHKVVLCIRQKYIRYKPFMAEVKDYACHRAGEPSSASASAKKARVLKREPYMSKRCGCGFRIRAIVPIANYNEKDKTFVYQEEGTAVFKLYAVHSGHEPGPLDGNARIIHRMVGHKVGFDQEPVVYGVREDTEPESFVNLLGKDDGSDVQHSVLQQVQELRVEVGLLEGKIAKMPQEFLGSLSQELSDILNRLRSLGGSQHSDEAMVVCDDEVGHWGENHHHHHDRHDRIFGKDMEMIEEQETDFDPTLGTIVPWDRITSECQNRKILIRGSCKSDKWLIKEDCGEFDEKSILNCGEEEDSKLIKPIRHDDALVTDPNLVGMPVDGFYPDNAKWYDSPNGLDPSADSGDGGFRHGAIV